MNKDIERIVFTAAEIDGEVQRIAGQINAHYAAADGVVLAGILRGSFMFLADLARKITVPTEIDFMVVSSYGQSARSCGEVRILKDLEAPVYGKHIVIVEDIIDTGLTLAFLKKVLLSREPASLKLCALLDKPSRREISVDADFKGFTAPDGFLVGYGLDYAQRYRNLPYIAALKKEVYS